MSRFEKLAFLASIVIHSSLLLFLWQRDQTFEPLKEVPFMIGLSSPPPNQAQKTKKIRKNKKAKIAQKSSSKNKAGFNYQSFSPSTYGTKKYKAGVVNNSHEWSGNPVMETMDSIDLPEYSSNYYFFESLVAKIHQNILYPKEFAENRITGRFWIKILVDRKGRLLQVIESSKNSPALCAYTILNIFQVLNSGLPEKHWYKRDKDLALHLQFDFSVTSVRGRRSEKKARYFKNRFDFVRIEKIPDILQEVYRDYARYIPPIVPTPMGPVIDFVQVYQMINAWSQPDPITERKQNLRLKREQIELMLEKAKKNHIGGTM